MDQFGSPATYCRADTGATVALTVMAVEPEYLLSADPGFVKAASDRWDILLRAADLVFGGTQYEPQSGDTVTIEATYCTHIYTALVEDGRRFCWTWVDHDLIRRKLKTKHTTSGASQSSSASASASASWSSWYPSISSSASASASASASNLSQSQSGSASASESASASASASATG